MKTTEALEIVIVAGVGWLIYKLLDAAKEKLDTAIAQPIADAIIRFTLPEPVNVTGAAILPDGKAVSMSELHVQKTPGKEQFWFAYKGATYQLGPRSVQGNYPTRVLK